MYNSRQVLPETGGGVQDVFLYLGRHRSRYTNDTQAEDELFRKSQTQMNKYEVLGIVGEGMWS